MKKTILLLGGGGYIGLSIAETLLSEGNKVIILDSHIYQHQKSMLPYLLRDDLVFINHDFRNELPTENGLKEITDVVLLGGLVGDPITKKYPKLSGEINGAAIRRTIKSLESFDIEKLIFISTCSNYGLIKEGDLADENFELNPLSLYSEEKVKNEKFLLQENDFNFSPTVLRFATAFGAAPRMRFDLTINEFVYQIYNKIDSKV